VASDGTYTLYPWAKDAAGNVSAAFGTPRTVVVDATAPTVTGFTATTPSASLNIPVTLFTATDSVGVTGYMVTTSSTPPTAGAAGWTGTAPTSYTVASDGTYTLYPWAKDALDNVSAAFGTPRTVVVDTTAPTVTGFTATTPSASLNIPITLFTATDSVGVTGYLITTSSTPPTAGATGWTGTAPTSYTVASDGTYTLYPWAKDALGNVSAVFGTPRTVVADTAAPTVTISSTAPNTTNTSPIPVTVHFNEPVAGFDSNGVSISNGNIGTITGAGTDYSFPVTPAGNGTVTVYIKANAAHDAAGNVNTQSATLTRTFDSVRPTVTISSTAPNPTNLSSIPLTVTFSKAVTGFTISGVSVTNGIPGSLIGSGTTYSFNVTPTANGTVTVNIAADVAQDAAGNGNFAAAPLTMTYDNIPPTVAISAPSLTVANSGSGPVTYTVTYAGADIVTLAQGNVALNTTGTASGTVTVSGTGTGSRTVTISNITGIGTLGISIAANTASDTAGNIALAAGPSTTFTLDNGSGDLNGDSNVDMVDALKVLRIAAGIDTPSTSERAHSDVAPLMNGNRQPDGKIDLGDVVAILRKAAGLPSW
jgi:hypothetical protein